LDRPAEDKPAVTRISKLTYSDPIDKDADLPAVSGKLSGVITDRMGAVIPGALVEITFKNIKKTALSNDNGFYLFENLPEGTYTIIVRSPGFKEFNVPQMKIENNSDERINAQLDVEATSFTMGVMIARTVIENPLIQAVYNGNIKQVRSLIANGTDVNQTDPGFSSRTALHTAVEENNLKIVRILLDAGADVNSLDEEGNTPLMLLDDETNVDIVSLLIKYGAKLDIQNKENKRTALLGAAMEENFKAMRILIEGGANVNLRDEDGDSALDLTDDQKIRQLLIAYGAEIKDQE
jgi:ankyrin repeat protein